MDLEREYNKLYEHWNKEVEEPELSPLSEEEFQNYKKFSTWVNTKDNKDEGKLEAQLKKEYQENINYLFSDFLKLRQTKIINAALSLEEINLEIVSDTEKLLYQNLVSSVKGFEKIKALSPYEDMSLEIPVSIIKEVEEKQEIAPPITDIIDIKQVEKEEILPEVPSSTTKESTLPSNEIKYIMVRFIKPYEEGLVGQDLYNYGPFEENMIVNLPYDNAIILINEKYAEEIELS